MQLKFKIDLKSRQVMYSLKNIDKITKSALRATLYDMGETYKRTAKEGILSSKKTGKEYKIGSGGVKRIHRASSPAEYPANLTGTLYNSIDYELQGTNQLLFGDKSNTKPSALGSGSKKKGVVKIMDYGRYLEEGTPKMQRRPHLLPALLKNVKETQNYLKRNIKKDMKKAATRP